MISARVESFLSSAISAAPFALKINGEWTPGDAFPRRVWTSEDGRHVLRCSGRPPLEEFILTIETAATRTRIRLDTTLLLGKGVVDAVKDAATLTSLIRATGRPCAADGCSAPIRRGGGRDATVDVARIGRAVNWRSPRR